MFRDTRAAHHTDCWDEIFWNRSAEIRKTGPENGGADYFGERPAGPVASLGSQIYGEARVFLVLP